MEVSQRILPDVRRAVDRNRVICPLYILLSPRFAETDLVFSGDDGSDFKTGYDGFCCLRIGHPRQPADANILKPVRGHIGSVKHIPAINDHSTTLARRDQSMTRNSSHSVTIRIASADWAATFSR